jgi:hypothetical protein
VVRLFQNDRFLIRRNGSSFGIFDMKNRRNVGNGKGEALVFTNREDAEAIRLEMTARVGLLSCEPKIRESVFSG